MKAKDREAEDVLAQAFTDAVNDLPILARLELAKNLIFDQGGDQNSTPQNKALVVANEILAEVINVIRKHPAAARIRSLEM